MIFGEDIFPRDYFSVMWIAMHGLICWIIHWFLAQSDWLKLQRLGHKFSSEFAFMGPFSMAWYGVIFNASVLFVIFLITWFSPADMGEGILMGEVYWQISRWVTVGCFLYLPVLLDIKMVREEYSMIQEKFEQDKTLFLNERDKVLSSINNFRKSFIQDTKKQTADYKKAIDSFEKEYVSLTETIEDEENMAKEIKSRHPRLYEIMKSRGIGDAKRAKDEQKKVFANTQLDGSEKEVMKGNDAFRADVNNTLTYIKSINKFY